MADHDLSPPSHGHHDDQEHHPRGGPWVRYVAISFALILAVALAPQSWKLPLGALSIVALLVGVGMLMLGGGAGGKRERGTGTEER